MEASLHPYAPGAIVEYLAPFDKKTCQRNRILSSHPVMIVSSTLPVPSSSVQCMMLTSKADSYYGYRLYMNTLDAKYRKFSVVCTTKIFTIEKCHLRAILGFTSPGFVRKCLMSYLYELGLVEEVPEYYRKSPIAQDYIEAGEPNIPSSPECFQIPNMPNGSFAKVNVASDTKLRFAHPNGSKGMIPRVIVNPNEYDAYYYEGLEETDDDGDFAMEHQTVPETDDNEDEPEINEGQASSKEEEPSEEQTHPKTEWDLSKDDTEITDDKETDISLEKGEAVDSKVPIIRVSSTLTPEIKALIEERDKNDLVFDGEVTKQLADLVKNLSKEDRYEIWVHRKSQYALMKEGKAGSGYMAKRMMALSNHQIKKIKEELITGILNREINLKFIGDRYILAFRCMTMTDIYNIKMGIATYISYLQSYDIPVERSYLGELQRGGLL